MKRQTALFAAAAAAALAGALSNQRPSRAGNPLAAGAHEFNLPDPDARQ